jgi:hypothetical protein
MLFSERPLAAWCVFECAAINTFANRWKFDRGNCLMKEKSEDTFSDEESARRFVAALHGARTAAPMPMKDIVGKGHKSRVKKTAQATPKLP